MIPAAIAAPLGSGIIQGIAGAFGGASQAKAARKAAQAQENAAREAIAYNEKMYNESKQAWSPYMEAGGRGLVGYEDAINTFQNPTLAYQQRDFGLTNWKDPGYDYRLAEAQKLIDASTSSKGMTLGSGALKSLQTRGQDMASQEYQNAYDRWLKDSALRYGQASDQWKRDYDAMNQNIKNWGDLTNIGVTGAQTQSQMGAGLASNITPLITGQGTAWGNAALAEGGAAAQNWSNIGKGTGDVLNQWAIWEDAQNKKNDGTTNTGTVGNQNWLGTPKKPK